MTTLTIETAPALVGFEFQGLVVAFPPAGEQMFTCAPICAHSCGVHDPGIDRAE